jgi:subtilisin family serine protease
VKVIGDVRERREVRGSIACVLALGLIGACQGGALVSDTDATHGQARSAPRPALLASAAKRIAPASPIVPGEVIVKLASRDDAAELALGLLGPGGTLAHRRSAALQAIFARHGVRTAEALASGGDATTARRTFKLSADARDPSALIAELEATPGVIYAEPNRVYTLVYAPNDPYFLSSGSWGQSYPDLWGVDKIGAPAAWNQTLGAGVVVAVVDSGIDYNHPDIAANVWQNAGEIGTDAQGRDKRTNGVDDDGNGFVDDWRGYNFASGSPLAANDPMDDFGHGTHVAGTIAAVGNNGVGVIGVAPAAKVMAVKGFAQDGSAAESDLANAMIYAARNGARVINASWGVVSTTPDLTMIDAVDEVHDTYGVTVVAAAGNNATDVGDEAAAGVAFYPAAAVNAIAVAATDHVDGLASFSDFGRKIDVAAPGGGDADPNVASPERSILSLLAAQAQPGLTGGGQLVVGGRYLRQAGTSMAAPHVAAAAALVLASHAGATPEQVRQAIRAGADDIGAPGWDAQTGFGRVNAGKAVAIPRPLSAHLTGPLTPLVGLDHVSVTGSAAGAGFASYRLDYGAGDTPTTWTTIVTATTPVASGTLADWPLGTVANGAYTLRLVSQTTDGASFEDRLPVSVQNLAIDSPAPGTSFSSGQIVTISGFADGPGFMAYGITIAGKVSGPVPASSVTLLGGTGAPVDNGTLAVWDTTGLLTDHYTITLSVSAADGTVRIVESSVIVDAALHPGWPWRAGDLGGASPGPADVWFGPTVIDLDGDGAAEILTAQGSGVYALRQDGTSTPGWPVFVDDAEPVALAPVAGDVTGDGAPEVVAASGRGTLYVWKADGSILLGWPQSLGATKQAIVLADLNHDGVKDIVAAAFGGTSITVLDHDANVLPGWPRTLDRPLGKPAVGDLDGDGTNEVVVPSLDGAVVYVLGADGQTRAGWPKTLSAAPLVAPAVHAAAPALVDVDGDGNADVVAGSADGKVVAWRADGTAPPGWPRATVVAEVSSPAVGDLDGDGRPEIVAGTAPVVENGAVVEYLYAWHLDGSTPAGWPIRSAAGLVAGGGFGAPAIADVDGDGKADVVVASDVGTPAYGLHAFRSTGAEVTGFPRPTPGGGAATSDAPAIADVDGDGLLEIVWTGHYVDPAFATPLSQIEVYDVSAPVGGPRPWPMSGRDAGQSGFVAPAVVSAPPLVALSRVGWRAAGSNATGTAAAFDASAGTRWSAGGPQKSGQFFELDLGAPATFTRITLDSRATAGDEPRGYQVFVSNDGVAWGTAIATGAGAGDLTTIDFPPQTARFIRIVQTGSSSSWWSIYDINVYGPPPAPVAIARAGWHATASAKASTAGSAVDGSLATRWTTGAPQTGGEWFELDLGASRVLSQLVLDSGTSKSDFPSGYAVTLSGDHTTWTAPVATGRPTQSPVTATFPQQSARYVRITQTGAASHWWSIAELSVLGPAPPPPAPVALPRAGWVASASRNGSTAAAAVDASATTRWTTGAPQASGQQFQLDLGAKRAFSQLTLDAGASPGDYPRAYQVLVSTDGASWGAPVASGVGSSRLTTISFPEQSARFVRIALSAASSSWWSIYDLGVWR